MGSRRQRVYRYAVCVLVSVLDRHMLCIITGTYHFDFRAVNQVSISAVCCHSPRSQLAECLLPAIDSESNCLVRASEEGLGQRNPPAYSIALDFARHFGAGSLCVTGQAGD